MKTLRKDVLSISFSNKDLCTRCGTCIGVCPTGALSLDENMFPKINMETCIECGLCAKACPGGVVNFKEMTKLTFGHDDKTDNFDGHVQRTFIGHSSDTGIHDGGAGGGMVTTLCWYLLNEGIVDGCIVARMNPEKPWQGEVFIARTYEDLLQSQQSKYVIIPTNVIFQELRNLEGKYAFVGLPCQVHGFRLMQKHQPKLTEKIHVAIGLFCASSLEPYVTTEMMETKGVEPHEITDFQFRGGEWPGRIRVKKQNGEFTNLHYSNFKDGAINYLTYLYSPPRCQTCIDGSSEFADLSVSDAWTRDSKGNYMYKGQSRLLGRTDKGVKVMQGAIDKGYLIGKDVSDDPNYITHRHHARKKGLTAKIRVERLKQAGKPVPEYDRECPPTDKNDRRTERMESFLMRVGRHRKLRYPLFKFLISKWGVPFIKIRQYRKSKKYR